MKSGKEITVCASPEGLEELSGFIGRELLSAACTDKTRNQIFIAIDEIFGNIMRYAYGDQSGDVTVCIENPDDPPAVEIKFMDKGIPFDPLERPDPNVTLKARDRKIGGLGIYMVKKAMDDMKYEYRDGMNILTIRKILG